MNFKEGMRRLALVAGALGACVGAYISYVEMNSLSTQRARHNEFQSLLSTPAVQRELRFLKNELPKAKDPAPAFKYAHHGQDWFDAAAAIDGATDGWVIKEAGVGKIYFGSHEEVNCISTEDGLRLYPTESPSLGSYLRALIWPILGFILPWVFLTVMTWVVTGFSHKP
jgi:hypothetical protein